MLRMGQRQPDDVRPADVPREKDEGEHAEEGDVQKEDGRRDWLEAFDDLRIRRVEDQGRRDSLSEHKRRRGGSGYDGLDSIRVKG